MRVLVQRCDKASVTVNNKIVGSIDKGLMILVGFTENDNGSNKRVTNYSPKIYRNMLHSIGHIPNIKKRCKHCGNKTPYFCKECNLYIHPECFQEFNKNNIYNKFNNK